MKLNKPRFLTKIMAISIILISSTAQATPSNTIDALLELLFPPATIEPHKNCPGFPEDCPSSEADDTTQNSDDE